jgi:hypothetical protein
VSGRVPLSNLYERGRSLGIGVQVSAHIRRKRVRVSAPSWPILAAGGCVTDSSIPTLEGFKWSSTDIWVDEEGSDGWCVRDAFCRLLGWERGSDEWSRFIRGPAGPDTPRLAEHLGLTVLLVPPDWAELNRLAAHPGLVVFDFLDFEKSHIEYVPNVETLLQWWPTPDGLPGGHPPRSTGWPLVKWHMDRKPVLRAVIIDQRQPPRGLGLPQHVNVRHARPDVPLGTSKVGHRSASPGSQGKKDLQACWELGALLAAEVAE